MILYIRYFKSPYEGEFFLSFVILQAQEFSGREREREGKIGVTLL
jgi:hypothetical protein